MTNPIYSFWSKRRIYVVAPPKMKSSIFFQPYKGTAYDKNPLFTKRTLVLSGSHYGGNTKQADDLRDFTHASVREYLERDGGPWRGTYTKFINSIYGREADQCEREQFFDSIVFYTYLQETAGEQHSDAAKSDYTAARHHTAFFEVLDVYKPEVVIAWGKKVWEALPNQWCELGEVRKGEPLSIAGKQFWQHYDYPYLHGRVLLVGADHPSYRRFSGNFHHQVFLRLGLIHH